MEPPEILGDKARARWAEIVALGKNVRNYDVLVAYCVAYQRWIETEEWLSQQSSLVATIRDDKGNIKSHGPAPQLKIAADACKEMTRLGKILNLNG